MSALLLIGIMALLAAAVGMLLALIAVSTDEGIPGLAHSGLLRRVSGSTWLMEAALALSFMIGATLLTQGYQAWEAARDPSVGTTGIVVQLGDTGMGGGAEASYPITARVTPEPDRAGWLWLGLGVLVTGIAFFIALWIGARATAPGEGRSRLPSALARSRRGWRDRSRR